MEVWRLGRGKFDGSLVWQFGGSLVEVSRFLGCRIRQILAFWVPHDLTNSAVHSFTLLTHRFANSANQLPKGFV